RGIERYGPAIEERLGTTVVAMAGHYRESVDLIESARPRSAFLLALHEELDRLALEQHAS
ncbi:MAG TPA: hypothetical protein VH391_07735, partial [Solirubrobacterales bacterium]